MLSNRRHEIRRRLVGARQAAKLTQVDVASEMSVTRQTVSSWERGSTAPSIEQFAVLCAVYGVSSDLILYGESSVRFGAVELQQISARVAASQGAASP